MDNKNDQLTVCQFNSTNDKNIRHGNANVPANVFNPFVSAFDIILNRPAKYL